jgi:hypothetical protein
MRLVRIRNKYLFNSDNPNGNHIYAVYYDRKTRQNRAVALTHLYNKDPKRFKQVSQGNIMVTRFKGFDTPTGVQNYYYSKNIYGNKINLKDSDIVKINKGYLPKRKADTIKRFAYKNYNK